MHVPGLMLFDIDLLHRRCAAAFFPRVQHDVSQLFFPFGQVSNFCFVSSSRMDASFISPETFFIFFYNMGLGHF